MVEDHPDATPFHLPGWTRVVAETYGFPSFVLRAGGARPAAGIPVVQVTGLLGHRRLVALPFTDRCPPLIAGGHEEGEFAGALARWRAATGAGPLEVRASLDGCEGSCLVGTRNVIDLDRDADAVFRRLHRNRVQRRVRRARELGVEITLGRSLNDLETFYSLHCRTRRRQGVPVQPKRFLQGVWEHLIRPGHGFVVVAHAGGTPVATALFLGWGRHLIYKYGASEPAYWRLGANFLVHWTAIEWGCRNGFETYDFGRTDEGHESLRQFKALWGGTESPLAYTTLGEAPRRQGQRRAAGAMARVIKRSPTVVCRALGELLYRYAA